MKKLSLCGLFVLQGAVVSACGGATSNGGVDNAIPGSALTKKQNAGVLSCERKQKGVGAVRANADTSRQGGAVALARINGSTIAYIADEDSAAIHTVDVDKRVELASTRLNGSPAQIVVLADGRVAATLRNTNRVQVLEPSASASAGLTSLCEITVPSEPIGIATTPDDKRLVVTSAWDKKVTVLSASTLETLGSIDVPREPRSVVVDDDGQRAFVAHVVGGTMSVVDISGENLRARSIDLRVKKIVGAGVRAADEDKTRGGCQGFALAKSIDVSPPKNAEISLAERPLVTGKAPKQPAAPKPKGRVFAPMVTVDPGDPNVRSFAYYGEVANGIQKEAPLVSVIDAEAERPMTRAVMSLGNRIEKECLLPRAAAVRPSTGSLFVACLGIDAVVELDTRGMDPARLETRRWSVPSGPLGIAIDDTSGRAIVWSQFDGKVSILDLNAPGSRAGVKYASVSYSPPPSVTAIAYGRKLFHASDDSRISNDGAACASCHPDGREDALTWSTPEGPRQTIMLAGRTASSAPYGWIGKHNNLTDYISNTFSRLGGSGVRGQELDDLVAYVDSMPGPLVENKPKGGDPSLLARGREIFFSEEQGCANCHTGGAGTDRVKHDVASKVTADLDGVFDTPSLHFIRGTAPYFHDGRYSTLDDVLAASDTKMGHTLSLPRRDVSALKAYLETL